MRLFIPACGDRIRLIKPWGLTLFLEHRNLEFARMRGLLAPENKSRHSIYKNNRLESCKVELSAGTVLECDRVYIRTFNKSRIQQDNDYDSITWKIVDEKKGKAVPKSRFWCKLSEACEIEYELMTDSFYRDRVKLFKAVHES